jgi:glycosyltransferase involved in cell wall biosynthesis
VSDVRIILSTKESENEYVQLHKESLLGEGIEVSSIKGISLFQALLFSSSGSIFHIHWQHFHYFSSEGIIKGIASFLLALRFILYLLIFRFIFNIKIVWEMHNYLPHEDHRRWLDILVLRFLLRLSNGIIGHCKFVLEPISKINTGYVNKVKIIPHPSFYGSLRKNIDKEKARQEIGLDNRSFICLYFGKIRPYKGVDNLIEVFKKGQKFNNSILVMAGRFEKEWYREKIEGLVDDVGNIVLIPHWIDESKMDRLFSSADCLVLPYRDILTSGTVLLGMEYCVPMVLPDVGCLREQVDEKYAVFYDNTDILENLEGALIEVLEKDIEVDREDLRKRIEELSWVVQIGNFIGFYKSLGC